MPKFVTVPVLKAFTHENTAYTPGQTAELTPIQAAIRARRGEVSLTVPGYRTKEIRASEEEEKPRARRSRKTPGEQTSQESEDTTKRQYRRRDMVPEQP